MYLCGPEVRVGSLFVYWAKCVISKMCFLLLFVLFALFCGFRYSFFSTPKFCFRPPLAVLVFIVCALSRKIGSFLRSLNADSSEKAY